MLFCHHWGSKQIFKEYSLFNQVTQQKLTELCRMSIDSLLNVLNFELLQDRKQTGFALKHCVFWMRLMHNLCSSWLTFLHSVLLFGFHFLVLWEYFNFLPGVFFVRHVLTCFRGIFLITIFFGFPFLYNIQGCEFVPWTVSFSVLWTSSFSNKNCSEAKDSYFMALSLLFCPDSCIMYI